MDIEPPAIDVTGDVRLALARQESDDRARARIQAGFPVAVGSGWKSLSSTVDDANNAGVRALATDLGIDIPIASRDRRIASIALPPDFDRPAPASAASAMAIVIAAVSAGHALGEGRTRDASSRSRRRRASVE